MGIGFSQISEHQTNAIPNSDHIRSLPDVIRRQTGIKYSCEKRDGGYFLKPEFLLFDISRRNSFVPEIDVTVSCKNGETSLHIKGQPVKLLRLFMIVWISFSLLLQIVFFGLMIFSEYESIYPLFIPFLLCLFGYSLCKIGTKITFRKVVKVIINELKKSAG